jgi:hypothetical protein
MDAATTGVEPYYSRASVKSLSGGGTMAIDRDVPEEEVPGPPREDPAAGRERRLLFPRIAANADRLAPGRDHLWSDGNT